ncbi:hypothetical protein H0H87_007358 [Tephrocybe sp. NHM501043]|nr:hypothetical protein H0H87_007358 [Tephrocybe sp. NHM501043]
MSTFILILMLVITPDNIADKTLQFRLSFLETGLLKAAIRSSLSLQSLITALLTKASSDLVNGVRTLGAATQATSTNNASSCIAFCDAKGYVYAGTEYSIVTMDSTLGPPRPLETAACHARETLLSNAVLVGDSIFTGVANNLPHLPVRHPRSATGHPSDVTRRTLTVGMAVVGDNTQAKCTTACFNAGYPLSGSEYSAECYCGNTIANGGLPTPAADCSMLCAGNAQEFCGGPNRLNVYNYTGTNLPPQTGGGGNGGDGTSVFPITTVLPGNFTYAGCWVDNAFGRIFPFEQPADPQNTVPACVATCASKNYTLAGTEFGTECYCGNNLIAGAVLGAESTCNQPCGGNATQACGGGNRLSVYTSTGTVKALPVPVPLKTGLPSLWQYKGCLREPTGKRALPYQIIWPTNNTALACMTQCAAFGFPASGTEFGQECYCGDKTDPIAQGAVFGTEAECTLPCPGDPISLCGAGDRLTYYEYNGTMNVWNTPTNTGRYESYRISVSALLDGVFFLFSVPGVTVPLIATLGINNKVTFLEKGGTGFPNSTGAYELDLTLTSNFSAAWREMHIKTDVFCAGSVILPDKAGRQINVGGWSLESTYGLRLYTPTGTDGVNGTSDWEEDYPSLSLQRGRWYPTAATMANGSILVIGGETGSNASPQPNLEILPKPVGGDTVIDLDWLQRTDPNNLYPFVFVLPSKRIFVAYWNEARILDPVTFDTYKSLPNIPGSVGNFLSGRTYPLAGAAMLLPQYAPYTDPLRVLICGGSTEGAGETLDNCVSIAPEDTNPTWVLERMPSKRVMACMVGLPDGTYFIANGAHQGVAGFGLANDPNLSALLYDPTKPLGSRFSILNSTIVARMYHSELTLLPDGRVLVSGSDPQTNFDDGTPKYPEEFRIESLTLWSPSSASSSTHGNSMGARTIFPAFTCAGTTCTITAPPHAGVSPPSWHQLFILDGPTPSHSKWVRIGGDPASLGNWPNITGFTIPGV